MSRPTLREQTSIACPTCSSRYSKIIDSRPTTDKRQVGLGQIKSIAIRRRRECENGHRYTTRETIPSVHINTRGCKTMTNVALSTLMEMAAHVCQAVKEGKFQAPNSDRNLQL